ncbi:DUF6438 domain-containing protein [Halalkalibacter alkaliphilus]|uniref:DUF6438 domain-containing protein n=1 Tax=Halalkalibacter alkaliphilus TaxID=2917993 RepID=A0A9X2CX72_9BACI|nr:DUF6438 domain-containing protein [Halalkalibacter alkaliphilus]MCL7749907.1 DUF6438 domain-containing protein [Halalkalibacter alkaliphilus]
MFNKIFLSRTPCYGDCPVFDVEVDHDGTVKWRGEMYVACLGEIEFKIPNNKIKKLEALLEEFNFRSFTYPEPDMFATDQSSCVTRVIFQDGFDKEVNHYLGEDTTYLLGEKHSLHNLKKFENKIEQIIGLRKYIKHPPLYFFHLKSEDYECIVSAPNQKEAISLAENEYKDTNWDAKKIGKDITGKINPYVVMDKKYK